MMVSRTEVMNCQIDIADSAMIIIASRLFSLLPF
jgi:hypothetical protein